MSAVVRVGLRTARAMRGCSTDEGLAATCRVEESTDEIPECVDLLLIWAPGYPGKMVCLDDADERNEFVRRAEEAGRTYVRCFNVARLAAEK